MFQDVARYPKPDSIAVIQAGDDKGTDRRRSICCQSRRLESTPRMKIDSWAVSEVSVLSSTAREYAMKSFPFPTSCCWRFAARH
ncbi:unnamed protein product [Pleuronectes platessa]|uniref:Uncharacterized protein n=1 Tax=Pleuronectes platessa TaxID=8262 RepID=A0A9N7V4P7_PLEPL|nr:unnamed protein product [Pleuronectes platessa]